MGLFWRKNAAFKFSSALENLATKKEKKKKKTQTLEQVTLLYVQGFADRILNGLVGGGGKELILNKSSK